MEDRKVPGFHGCKSRQIEFVKEKANPLICELTDLNGPNFARKFFYDSGRKKHGCELGESLNLNMDCFDALAFFDIVAFKAINDRFSYNLGDLFIKEFAKLLSNEVESLRKDFEEYDFEAFRLGGDEFCVMALRRGLDCSTRNRESYSLLADFERWTKSLVNKWNSALWIIKNNFSTGDDAYALELWNEESAPANLDKQRFFIKGIQVRGGVGISKSAANDNAKKNELPQERGVFNDACSFYSDTISGGFPPGFADCDGWKRMRDYIILTFDPAKNPQLLESRISNIKVAIEETNFFEGDVQFRKWNQDSGGFLAIPINYTECTMNLQTAMDEHEDLQPYKSLLKSVSWVTYSRAYIETFSKEVDKRILFFLSGKGSHD